MQLLEQFLWVHLVILIVMLEIATTVSFGMLLGWLLKREYKSLFGVPGHILCCRDPFSSRTPPARCSQRLQAPGTRGLSNWPCRRGL